MEKKTIILDCDCGGGGEFFYISLEEPLKLSDSNDIYIESFTTFDCVTSRTEQGETSKDDNIGFLIGFDQFSIKSVSNNKLINNKIFIPNEQSSNTPESISKSHKGSKLNYVRPIRPTTITQLSGKITLLDGSTSIFNNSAGRFILEILLVSK